MPDYFALCRRDLCTSSSPLVKAPLLLRKHSMAAGLLAARLQQTFSFLLCITTTFGCKGELVDLRGLQKGHMVAG